MQPTLWRIAAFLVLGLAWQSLQAQKNNVNDCIRESAGVGGFQFTNGCGVPIRAYFRGGGIDGALGHGSWHAIALGPGQSRLVSGYSAPVYACPIVVDGKEIAFDTGSRACVHKQGARGR